MSKSWSPIVQRKWGRKMVPRERRAADRSGAHRLTAADLTYGKGQRIAVDGEEEGGEDGSEK